MAAKKYLVPIDFSTIAAKALHYAAQLAEKSRGSSLLVLHVITEPASHVPFYLRKQFYAELEQSARKRISSLLKRKPATRVKCAIVVVRAADAAGAIAREAKKSRAAMIVMGSHGRKGLKRLLLGSVAEKTAGSAACPVLIIK